MCRPQESDAGAIGVESRVAACTNGGLAEDPCRPKGTAIEPVLIQSGRPTPFELNAELAGCVRPAREIERIPLRKITWDAEAAQGSDEILCGLVSELPDPSGCSSAVSRLQMGKIFIRFLHEQRSTRG